LTSAANHEISKSQSGLFIPNGICLNISGGGFIQEGSDNVDLNTETIDGKIHSIEWQEQYFKCFQTNRPI
jgi:hypothetical protein